MEKFWKVFSTNFGLKSVSIVIAVVLWMIALGSRVVEENLEVPLEILTAADIVPANEIPEQVVFRVSGPKAFLRSLLERKDQPIRVNLSTEKPRLVPVRFSADNIHLPLGVKVLSINPSGVLVKLENVKKREIPVRLELRGTPMNGYRVVGTELNPKFIKVKGAETRVDQLNEISTVPVDIADAKKTIQREVQMNLSRFNVQLDGDLPQVTVKIEPASANFRIRQVDVQVHSAPGRYQLETKKVTVLVRAEPDQIKFLDKTKVFAKVTLRGLTPGEYLLPLEVIAPEGVGVVKVIPEKIKVKIW